MKIFTLPALLAAALFSALVVVPFLPSAAPKSEQFHFEITVTSSTPGLAQIFFDIGHGFNEADSTRVELAATAAPQRLSFVLPAGNYRALRFDPIDREGTLTLGDALIRNADGRVARRFAPEDFVADQQIARREVTGDRLAIATTPHAYDPIMSVKIGGPFALHPSLAQDLRFLALRVLPVFVALLALLWLLGRGAVRLRATWPWLVARPARAVALTALLAVLASSYPVVFLGKSIVSPNLGTTLLYEGFPTLPGYTNVNTIEVKSADIGAIIWSHVPLSMLQHDALFRDHELPLWNRYNSAGTPLLGQGQSMFGDPLHFFVIAANGAAWAWDLKYLAAKWLLACGLGLIVWSLTRHLPSALLVAFAADFVGFFEYRVNHPAFFSFCYAPWILWCWLRMTGAPRWTGTAWWTAALMLANWTVMNSGTVKEAYMLLLTMNFSGACVLALTALPVRERLRRFAIAAWGGALFVLLSAPVWLTFLDALHQSYTGYNDPRAYQVQPSLLLALFDEVFYRPFNDLDKVYNPSGNFLFLTGLLACAVYLRIVVRNRAVLALGLSALVPLALVYGLVPPQWIAQVPFLGNVAHIDNSFSCALILLVAALAGVGFAAAAARLGRPEGRGDLGLAALLLGALVFPYIAFTQTVQRSAFSYLHWGESLPFSPFVWGSLVVLLTAAVALMFLARRILVRGATTATVLLAVTCGLLLLWRHGWHARVGFAGYVINPTLRTDFSAPSKAIGIVQADQAAAPSRTSGIEGSFFHGWNDVYRLEGICGPDALVNPFYREIVEACGVERIWDWRLLVSFATLAKLKPVYDFMGIRHYLDYLSNHEQVGAVVKPVAFADLDVYRSDSAWPRAFFTDRLDVYDQSADLAQKIKAGDGRPFAAVQRSDLGTQPALLALPRGTADRTVAPAANYRLTGNTTAFDVDASGPGVVVLQEAWMRKDFQARLNGQRVPYLRVNHAFKGITVPAAGHYRVEFSYWPRRFTLALWLCAAGAALLAASLAGVRWHVRRPAASPVPA